MVVVTACIERQQTFAYITVPNGSKLKLKSETQMFLALDIAVLDFRYHSTKHVNLELPTINLEFLTDRLIHMHMMIPAKNI